MTKYQVTFNQNVKFKAAVFRKGETASVDEVDIEGLEGVILPDYSEVEKTRAPAIEDMTVAQLKEYAAKHNIDLAGAKKRDDMLVAIQG